MHGCAKSRAEADTCRNQTATGVANMDEDRVVQRLMERMQAMEAEMASSVAMRDEVGVIIGLTWYPIFPSQKDRQLF
jgi:hypothetical protein